MDGATLGAGAICCATRVRNPVLAARRVMEASEHVLFAGEGADAFAAALNSRNRITSPRRVTRSGSRRAQRSFGASPSQQPAEPLDPDRKHGTARSRSQHGHIAAATSTGGITNKQPGRVGDSPIIGAGCYADTQRARIVDGHRRDVHPARDRT